MFRHYDPLTWTDERAHKEFENIVGTIAKCQLVCRYLEQL
jgi:hypothetical protein